MSKQSKTQSTPIEIDSSTLDDLNKSLDRWRELRDKACRLPDITAMLKCEHEIALLKHRMEHLIGSMTQGKN